MAAYKEELTIDEFIRFGFEDHGAASIKGIAIYESF
jgi:hypothetical protein